MTHLDWRRVPAALAVPALLALLLSGCATPPAPELEGTVATRCVPRKTNIYYESWRPNPNGEGLRQLHSFQASFAGCKINHVRIVGMAGALGGDAINEQLSEKRARFVSHELQRGGWDPAKFEVVAIGKQGATVDGVDKPMRRRTHIDVEASVP